MAANSLTLAWNANPESDIAGYRIRYGTSSGNYSSMKEVVGNGTTGIVDNLTPGVKYYFVVAAYNTGNLEGMASTEISTVYTLPDTDADQDGLPDSWETQYGITDGAGGDSDRDGISNLTEYAMNLNPAAPQGPSPTPTSIQMNAADGKQYLTISYPRRINATGLTFTLEATSDLTAGWNTAPSQFEQVGSPVPSADGVTEVVTVRVLPAISDSTAPGQLVRVRVVKQ